MRVLLILSGLVLSTVLVRADDVKFATSTTTGCFSSTTCTPGSNQFTASTTDLSFSGSSFGQPNGIATTNGVLSLILGQFTLTDQTTAIIDKDFYSTITFTLPKTIDGGQSTSAFNADVLGVVKKDAFGFVYIDFDTSTQHFAFSNALYTGSFDFNVSSLLFGDIGKGSKTVNWYGQVTNAVQNPKTVLAAEPTSFALLGTAIPAMGLIRRRMKMRKSS